MAQTRDNAWYAVFRALDYGITNRATITQPFAISASEVGVDGTGHTKWVLNPGKVVEDSRRLLYRSLMVRVNPRLDSSATICIDDASVTYIAGSTDATLIEPLRQSSQLRENCRISNSVAVCAEIASATGTMKTLQTTTETVKPVEVQVSIDIVTILSRIVMQPLDAKLNIPIRRSTRRVAASSPLSPSACFLWQAS